MRAETEARKTALQSAGFQVDFVRECDFREEMRRDKELKAFIENVQVLHSFGASLNGICSRCARA